MATNLSFSVAAFDKASTTFLKVAERVDKLADKLDALDRKQVEVKVDVDTRVATNKIDKLSHKIDIGLSGAIIKVVALGRAMGALTAPVALVGMVPTLAAVASTAASASGALLLLPAAGAAAAVAFGALKLGTRGWGDAMKALGDPEKFAEAIAKLSPEARQAARAVDALRVPFNKLKDEIQDRLFEGMAERIRDLGKVGIPLLERSFERVAGTANRAALQVADLFISRKSDLATIADNSASAFANLGKALAPVTRALLDIATVGSDFLPGMTKNAGGLAQNFADFIAEARQTGELQTWIQVGLDVLKELGKVAVDVLGIVRGIFRAAGAGSQEALGPVGLLLDRINQWVNSVEGQTALSTFFTSATRIIEAFLPILAKVAHIVGTVVAPALADMAEALAPGMTAIVEGLADALRELADTGALTEIARAMSDVAIALAPLLPDLARLGGEILLQLAGVIIRLAPELPPLVDALGEFLIALIPLLPAVTDLIDLSLRLALLVLPPLVAALQIVTAELEWVSEKFTIGREKVGSLTDSLLYLRDMAFASFVPLGDMITNISDNVIMPALERIKSTLGSLAFAFGATGLVMDGMWNEMNRSTIDKMGGIVLSVRKGINKLLAAWNWVAEKLNLSVLQLPYLDVAAAGGGGGGGGAMEHMAAGGPVPGTGNKDSVHAMLTPGEVVFSKLAIKNLGGLRTVEALHATARQGRSAFERLFGGDPDEPGLAYFAEGGAVERGLTFARAQAGKPYIWAGVGPQGWDCSGLMSGMVGVLTGGNPYTRRFATGAFGPGRGAGGLQPGLNSAFGIGVVHGNPGHTAGTLGGVNIEATPPVIKVGPGARGADHPSFNMHFHLPQVGGEFVGGGGGGIDFGGLVRKAFGAITPDIPGFGGGTALLKTLSTAMMNKLLERVPGFANGGIVPGAYGAPSLATVHGGEAILGLGWERRLADALVTTRNGGGGNHYHLTVMNANNNRADIEATFQRMEMMSGAL